MKSISVAFSISLILLLTGCFAKIHHLPAHPDKTAPVFVPLPDQDVLVGIAVSGGGSRAATFAAAALEALANIRITESGQPRSVLETVTHMSSVSGGSLATAYYAVKKPAKAEAMLTQKSLSPTYQQFFASFKKDMQKNFEWPVIGRQLIKFRATNPTKAAHSFADVWDANFFDEITFSELYEREKRGDAPRIMLNGTIYNTGRRLVLTTLPPEDFSYDFPREWRVKLEAKLKAKGQQFTSQELARELASFDRSVERAKNQFLPQTFEGIKGDHHGLPVSLAVATSAAFPPVVGPVTYQMDNIETYTHVGDGGLFDNLGTESLATLFLKKLNPSHPTAKKGLIIVIDASYPFSEGAEDLNKNKKGFDVFTDEPARIVGIMEERANAYQSMLWHSLRADRSLIPDDDHLKLVFLRHTEAEWTKDDPIPDACPKTLTPEGIVKTIRQIPTLFRIKDPCHGALLIAAARKVVLMQGQSIVDFLQTAP